MVFQSFDDVGDSRSLLTDGNVDAVKSSASFNVWVVKGLLLVDDCVNSNSSFTSLSISNNKLSLSSSNRYQRIYRFKASLHRFVH